MDRDAKAADLAGRAEDVVLAALKAAGQRPDALWIAGTMLLGIAAQRLGGTPSGREDLLMLGEHLARQAAERIAAAGEVRP